MNGGSLDEWKVRILHISDLHERGPRESESFRRRRVLGDAWKRNLDELLEAGRIGLVCFTGDVADRERPQSMGRPPTSSRPCFGGVGERVGACCHASRNSGFSAALR